MLQILQKLCKHHSNGRQLLNNCKRAFPKYSQGSQNTTQVAQEAPKCSPNGTPELQKCSPKRSRGIPWHLQRLMWINMSLFRPFLINFGAILGSIFVTFLCFAVVKGLPENISVFDRFFNRFSLNFERLNIEFDMVFIDPNACRPFFPNLVLSSYADLFLS